MLFRAIILLAMTLVISLSAPLELRAEYSPLYLARYGLGSDYIVRVDKSAVADEVIIFFRGLDPEEVKVSKGWSAHLTRLGEYSIALAITRKEWNEGPTYISFRNISNATKVTVIDLRFKGEVFYSASSPLFVTLPRDKESIVLIAPPPYREGDSIEGTVLQPDIWPPGEWRLENGYSVFPVAQDGEGRISFKYVKKMGGATGLRLAYYHDGGERLLSVRLPENVFGKPRIAFTPYATPPPKGIFAGDPTAITGSPYCILGSFSEERPSFVIDEKEPLQIVASSGSVAMVHIPPVDLGVHTITDRSTGARLSVVVGSYKIFIRNPDSKMPSWRVDMLGISAPRRYVILNENPGAYDISGSIPRGILTGILTQITGGSLAQRIGPGSLALRALFPPECSGAVLASTPSSPVSPDSIRSALLVAQYDFRLMRSQLLSQPVPPGLLVATLDSVTARLKAAFDKRELAPLRDFIEEELESEKRNIYGYWEGTRSNAVVLARSQAYGTSKSPAERVVDRIDRMFALLFKVSSNLSIPACVVTVPEKGEFIFWPKSDSESRSVTRTSGLIPQLWIGRYRYKAVSSLKGYPTIDDKAYYLDIFDRASSVISCEFASAGSKVLPCGYGTPEDREKCSHLSR